MAFGGSGHGEAYPVLAALADESGVTVGRDGKGEDGCLAEVSEELFVIVGEEQVRYGFAHLVLS